MCVSSLYALGLELNAFPIFLNRKEKKIMDYNMLNNVPYNVSVAEFQPEREAPIFPHITRKYPCIEDVVNSEYASFDRLTWKIQQPDRSMVWSSVKLVLPLEMESWPAPQGGMAARDLPDPLGRLDMRATQKKAACNIAVAESPMTAFRQSSLTLNGRIFSEVNNFRKTLDACYRGVGAESYGDGQSLKPVVCRDIVPDQSRQYVTIMQAQPGGGQYSSPGWWTECASGDRLAREGD